MFVRFNRRYLAFRPGDVTQKIGHGVAIELEKRGIITRVDEETQQQEAPLKRKRRAKTSVRESPKASRKRPATPDRNNDGTQQQ